MTESDAGTRTIREVFEELQIDDAWSTWSDRGFTWWPHRLAQRVWAEEPREDDGFIVVRVNAETDLFSLTEQEWTELAPEFEVASMFASMSGYIWGDGVVRLRCSMWVHADTQPWVSRVFRVGTITQAVAAEDAAMRSHQELPVHESGERTEPDEMLQAIHGLPGRDEPSTWGGPEMEMLAETLTSNGALSTGSQDSLLAEFPYGEHGGPAPAGGASNLLTVSTDEPHPSLGSGLLMRLSLREQPSGQGKPLNPLGLNEQELRDGCQAHFLGSWCANPSEGPPVYVSFLPNVLSAPNMLTNLVVAMGVRSNWAAQYVSA